MIESHGAELYQLIYRSRSALAGTDALVDDEVETVIAQSARNNARDGVTGALMFTASVFIQVLEGRCTDLERTFERICCDLRHMHVELMSFSPVAERTFGVWNMHRVDADATTESLFRQLGHSDAGEGVAVDAISRAVAQMVEVATGRAAQVGAQAELRPRPVLNAA